MTRRPVINVVTGSKWFSDSGLSSHTGFQCDHYQYNDPWFILFFLFVIFLQWLLVDLGQSE